MKKMLCAAVAGALAVAAVAFGAGQVNTYHVAAKTSPTTAGTSKKPVPVSLTFNFAVGETNNQRPAVVKQYAIQFNGIHVTTSGFKTCGAQRINAAQTNSVCPS